MIPVFIHHVHLFEQTANAVPNRNHETRGEQRHHLRDSVMVDPDAKHQLTPHVMPLAQPKIKVAQAAEATQLEGFFRHDWPAQVLTNNLLPPKTARDLPVEHPDHITPQEQTHQNPHDDSGRLGLLRLVCCAPKSKAQNTTEREKELNERVVDCFVAVGQAVEGGKILVQFLEPDDLGGGCFMYTLLFRVRGSLRVLPSSI